jgi:uncharacterized protein YjbI with pentapeptide repeats
MANEEHLAILEQGVDAWNEWRTRYSSISPDLSEVDFGETRLYGANFYGANFYKANFYKAILTRACLIKADLRGEVSLIKATLSWADLRGADLAEANLLDADLYEANISGANLYHAMLSNVNLWGANLSGANLREAHLYGANLYKADLRGADLRGADLRATDLSGANLRGANLTGADLQYANLVDADLSDTNLTGCRIYGISAWGLNLEGAKQQNFIITEYDQPEVTVDNIEVAQFIYLLLYNEKIREVIDTITSKAVLILGRFTPERKAVLDAMRDELRHRNYLPIVFDFEKPASRDLTETISTLAHMARFIIADLTEAKSIPQELQRIVPDLPSVPVQPVLQASAEEYSMFEHFKRYPWVLETYRYQSLDEVITALPEKVIAPAELKAKELVGPMKQ